MSIDLFVKSKMSTHLKMIIKDYLFDYILEHRNEYLASKFSEQVDGGQEMLDAFVEILSIDIYNNFDK